MEYRSWNEAILAITRGMEGSIASIDLSSVREGVNLYAVPSFDDTALQFSLPVRVRRNLELEFGYSIEGVDGAVGAIIEYIKWNARRIRELSALHGEGIPGGERFADFIEPCTLIHSERIGVSSLWLPDGRNYYRGDSLFLSIRGAIPYPGPPLSRDVKNFKEILDGILHAIGESVSDAPDRTIREWWMVSIDQKRLRERLPRMGLVSFIGDGSMPAREYTRYRCIDATAGPKGGIHVPFRCPNELDPVEVVLEGSGDRIMGLGIKRGEVLGIVGSNAEGKSTLLQAILAGEDDHAPGDGRERIVTLRGGALIEAVEIGIHGADVSLFFRRLPPGVNGTPSAVWGRGSASLCMAARMQSSIARGVPLILIDEDRAASNLLVPSSIQSEGVVPLSRILADSREAIGGTAIVFAASALDLLIAQADRLLLLQNHVVHALDRQAFRRRLRERLKMDLEILGDA